MKKLLPLVAAALAVAAPSASAAAKAGSYSGRTDADESITFRVAKGKLTTVSARFTTVCANPNDPADPLLVTLKPKPSLLGVSAKVKANGSFSFKTSGETAAQNGLIVTTFKGRAARSGKVKGTLRVQFPASTAGYDDYGDCDTGAIAFTARRR